MDCREAGLILSAAHDGEERDTALIDEARRHCDTCSECRAFARALAALSVVPPTPAPAALAEKTLAAIAAAPPETAEDEAPEGVAAWAPWLTRQRLWAWTGALAAVAVVSIMVILVGTGTFGAPGGEQSTREALNRALTSQGSPPAAAPSAPEAGAAAPASAAAPNYILFSNGIYVQVGPVESTASVLSTVGSVASDLGTGGSPRSVTVLRSATATTSIVIPFPDGGLQSFALVTRTLGGKTYQLTTGIDIVRFGQWPTLPSNYPPPSSPTGAPTFAKAGTDDSGVSLYTPGGLAPTAGFAIAPGTGTGDPAAGNPNWTWWKLR